MVDIYKQKQNRIRRQKKEIEQLNKTREELGGQLDSISNRLETLRTQVNLPDLEWKYLNQTFVFMDSRGVGSFLWKRYYKVLSVPSLDYFHTFSFGIERNPNGTIKEIDFAVDHYTSPQVLQSPCPVEEFDRERKIAMSLSEDMCFIDKDGNTTKKSKRK